MKQNKTLIKSENAVVIFFLIIWPLIILPKTISTIIVCALLSFFVLFNKQKRDKISNILLMIFCIQLISSFLFFIFDDVSLNRFFAAINTSLMWLCASFFYSLTNNLDSKKMKTIKTINYINLFILITLSVVYIANKSNSPNIILLDKQLGFKEVVGYSTKYRFSGFMEYSGLVGVFTIFCVYWSLKNSNKIVLNLIIASFGFIPVYLSKSRIMVFAYLIFIVFYFLLSLRSFREYKLIYFFLTVCSLGVSFLFFNQIIELLTDVLNSRVNSNSFRFSIYRESIFYALKNNILFGVGIKIDHGIVPLGSHSTFVGIFYKNGLVGLTLFLYMLIISISKFYQKKDYLSIFMMTSLLIIFIFEDIDGTMWEMVLFSCVLSLGVKGNEIKLQKKLVNNDLNDNIYITKRGL